MLLLACLLISATISSCSGTAFQACMENEKYPSRCIPEFECHVKDAPICKSYLFFNIVCCPIYRVPITRTIGRDKGECVTNGQKPGKCIPQFECPHINPKICKKYPFFNVVCCPIEAPTEEIQISSDQDSKPNTTEAARSTWESSSLQTNATELEDIPSERSLLKKLEIPYCGTKGIERVVKVHIVGGRRSRKHEWPWMAAIFRNFSNGFTFICGGTIIQDQYVISAAHCFDSDSSSPGSKSPEKYFVRLGEHNLTDSDNGDEYLVQEIIVHKDYSPPMEYNDIALIKLERKIEYNPIKVWPICLPLNGENSQSLEGKQVTTSGWGTLEFAGQDSDELREVKVPVTSNADCDKSYRELSVSRTYPDGIKSTMLCAGLEEGGKDTCQGDSGGPLMIENNSTVWKLVGIVSGGYQCARENFPGIYTRVSEYLPWIANNIN